MAYPWLGAEGFEAGTRGTFDGETDTDAKLSFEHYTQMFARHGIIPYRGSYSMMVDVGIAQGNDAFVEETGDYDTSGAIAGHFYLWAAPQAQWTMADNDLFEVMTLESSAGATSEGVVWLEDNSGVMEMGISETGSSNANTIVFPMGVWNLVEWAIDVSGNTFDAFLNGVAFTQISGTIAAIVDARFGVLNEDAGTTAGVLYFDEIVVDDARTRGIRHRFPHDVYWVTHNQHTHIGPGKASAYMSGSSTDALATFYDTDSALNGGVGARIIGVLRTPDDRNSDVIDLSWQHGLYVEVSGANPQVFVKPTQSIWMSEGAAKSYIPRRHPVTFV